MRTTHSTSDLCEKLSMQAQRQENLGPINAGSGIGAGPRPGHTGSSAGEFPKRTDEVPGTGRMNFRGRPAHKHAEPGRPHAPHWGSARVTLVYDCLRTQASVRRRRGRVTLKSQVANTKRETCPLESDLTKLTNSLVGVRRSATAAVQSVQLPAPVPRE